MSVADIFLSVVAKINARLTNINMELVAKGQTEATTLNDVPAKIKAIETGADVSGVTADPADVRVGEKFVNTSGEIVDGTMPDVAVPTPSISVGTDGKITASVTQSAGYTPGGTESGTKTMTVQAAKTITPSTSSQTAVAKNVYTTGEVTVAAMPTATQATPSVSVDANGLITASTTQSAGYVAAGTKSGTKQLTTQAAKTVTPTKSSQTAVAKNVYTTGVVTVGAIPSQYQDVSGVTAGAGDVLTGKKIVNSSGTVVTGTMANNGVMNKTMDGLDTKSVTIPAGYTSGGTVSLTGDIDEIVDEQADLLAELDAAVDALPDAGSGVSIETCTLTVERGSISAAIEYLAFENDTITTIGIADGTGTVTVSNVICGSFFSIKSSTVFETSLQGSNNASTVRLYLIGSMGYMENRIITGDITISLRKMIA